MATLSLAMIVKNEEKTLERVLACAQGFCDELIVADTGSTDNTVAIAKRMGAKVIDFTWIDDFSAARNAAFNACTGDWIVWLDADDIVTPDNQARFRQLKETLLNQSGIIQVMCTYEVSFNAKGDCDFSYARERIICNNGKARWKGVIHEYVETDEGETVNALDICIEHRPLPELQARKVDRNIKILEKAYNQGDRSPRTTFYYGNELKDHHRFADAIAMYTEYLANPGCGWEQYQAMVQAYHCAIGLNDEKQALEWAHRAIRHDSTRAEAWNLVGMVHYKREEWERAIPFFTAASSCPRPSDGFVNNSDYTWVPGDYLSICYDRLKNYTKAIELSLQTLPLSPEAPRLKKNLHWLIDQL
ncbi:MAG: glycosyltransferase [Vampirovibrionales bacterium]|nr:glycosyltransferase [Vampirovibrionales bacterium]